MESAISNGISVHNTTIDNLFAYVELGAAYHTDYTSNADVVDMLEYAMWQARVRSPTSNHLNYAFNNTITSPLAGLGGPIVRQSNGTFSPNATFLEILPDEKSGYSSDELHRFVSSEGPDHLTFLEVAPSPIAVQCQARSHTGTATLDPDEMAFDDFSHVPPTDPTTMVDQDKSWTVPTMPFARGVWSYLFAHHETILANILDSTNAPAAVKVNTSQAYPGYLQAEHLHRSLMRAFAVDALQLMYDGRNTFEGAARAETLRSSTPGKILGPGVVPAYIPAATLAIWAAGCVVLGVRYGFRRRWAETLDGYSFLRFGADCSGEINSGSSAGVMAHGAEFYRNRKLGRFPGLVGDVQFRGKVGRVGLVDPPWYAARKKLYL
jgi:hypothetical protein